MCLPFMTFPDQQAVYAVINDLPVDANVRCDSWDPYCHVLQNLETAFSTCVFVVGQPTIDVHTAGGVLYRQPCVEVAGPTVSDEPDPFYVSVEIAFKAQEHAGTTHGDIGSGGVVLPGVQHYWGSGLVGEAAGIGADVGI